MISFVVFAVVFFGAFVSTTGIHIEATPSSIVLGVTRHLDVKCVTTRERNSTMETLISLIISRSTNPPNTTFKELASLTMSTPVVQITDVSEINLTATGNIDNNGESYISLVWEYPDATKSGVYKCEARGIDHLGHNVYAQSTTLVSSTHPDVDTLSGQIKTLTSLIEQLTEDGKQQKKRLDSWSRRLEVARQNMFTISPIFNGRRYLLSRKHSSLTLDDAAAECNLFGGYVAEIDSDAEHKFIIEHLLATEHYLCVAIGAKFDVNENIWINTHSNTTVTYFNWLPGKPDRVPFADCLCLLPPAWFMHEMQCSFSGTDYSIGYICEVPEEDYAI
ncbi:uncharacterized protein LOC131958138 [Physella acuta]|uniref:uncharacterized protein LOC131958138 n=1 Tax=Physella acuta TaxID=109671 RepID=UPI0027DB6E41|nr:uncharacterized protein LOC131958138 [Physella acuta]